MVVGILKLSFLLRGNDSLKGKRHVLKKIKDRIKAKFEVAIAEVDANDSWESFSLGIASVGSDGKYVNSVLDKVKGAIDEIYLAEIVDSEFELINY